MPAAVGPVGWTWCYRARQKASADNTRDATFHMVARGKTRKRVSGHGKMVGRRNLEHAYPELGCSLGVVSSVSGPYQKARSLQPLSIFHVATCRGMFTRIGTRGCSDSNNVSHLVYSLNPDVDAAAAGEGGGQTHNGAATVVLPRGDGQSEPQVPTSQPTMPGSRRWGYFLSIIFVRKCLIT